VSKSKKILTVEELVDQEVSKVTNEQYKIVKVLKEDKERLEAEISHLKLLLSESIPTIKFEVPQLGVVPNEQLICETQIQFLKEQAITRSLTTDEAKRFQIFVDVLTKIKTGGIDKEDEITVKKLSNDDLLKLAENVGN
jgi:alpha-glucosidase (family GH31 glycosyl hydrolase)